MDGKSFCGFELQWNQLLIDLGVEAFSRRVEGGERKFEGQMDCDRKFEG